MTSNRSARTLFIDDGDINAMDGVTKVIHPADKYEGNPVVEADKEWEGGYVFLGGTVRREETGYRMWYESSGGDPRRRMHMYAESQDGTNWTKPMLNQHQGLQGGRDNNIYISLMRGDHNHNILYTPHMGEGRTYSLLSYGLERPEHNASDGYYLAFSEDGLSWSDAQPKPVIPGHQDVGWFMYDDLDREWRGIVKTYLIIRNKKRRSVMCTVSDDGFNWSLPHPAVIPDKVDDEWTEGNPDHYTQCYGMPIFRYESMVLGFLQVFKCTDGVASWDGTTDVQLVSSRDGRDWHRVGDRSPILERGPEGSFDWGLAQTGNALVTDGDIVRTYYYGSGHRHGQPGNHRGIGLASWPRDRFVGLTAGPAAGEVRLTLRPAARELHVNANADGGSLVAEILGQDGRPVTGFEESECIPLKEDSLDHELRWRSGAGMSSLGGRSVRVSVRLARAEIFSLWWE